MDKAKQSCRLASDHYSEESRETEAVTLLMNESDLRAAKAGDVDAQYRVACWYSYSALNPQEAVKWYAKAAKQGHAASQSSLASCYQVGLGVSQDKKAALKWLLKAAEQGASSDQISLAETYLAGDGITKDTNEALRWYRKAAQRGNKHAQHTLAYESLVGTSLPNKPEESLKWYTALARKGDREAQFKVGYMYLNGTGAAESYVEAYKWFSLAKTQGYAAAVDELTTLKLHMTEQQIAQAQALAAKCYESGYKDCD